MELLLLTALRLQIQIQGFRLIRDCQALQYLLEEQDFYG